MKNKLQQYFPMIRTREEVNAEIERRPELKKLFFGWPEEAREEFLDLYCLRPVHRNCISLKRSICIILSRRQIQEPE